MTVTFSFLAFLQLVSTSQAPALELVQTLPASPNVFFGEVTDLDRAPDGSVAVLDNLSHAVQVFDAAGRHVRTIGREGAGPGELAGAEELEVAPDGRVAVLDYRNRRITVWAPDGRVEATHRLDAVLPAGGFWPHDLIHNQAGLFLKASAFVPGEPVQVVRLREDWTGITDTLVTFVEGGDAVASCTFCAIAVDEGGRVVAAAGDTLYRVAELDRHGRARVVWERHDVPAAPRSADELRRLRQRAVARGAAEGATEGRIRPYRARFPPKSLGVDAIGRLWALPTAPDGASSAVDVFNREGNLLGSIDLAGHAYRLRVRGDWVIAAGESEAGEPVVWVYRIVG